MKIAALLLSCVVSQFANYNCDPNQCKLPACKCATTAPPVPNPPQFILITFDDAINEGKILLRLDVVGPARALFANRRNPNGCPAKATFFAQAQYSNPILVQQWYSQGNEIADHSYTHVSPFAGTRQEIDGMRSWATAYGGIPRSQIKGVRFPFRNYNKEAIEMLAQSGFEYDSSMAAQGADVIWPYTLDNGVVTECQGANPVCNAGVVAKGLWEIPMYGTTGEGGFHLMDPYNDPSITAPLSPESVTKLYTDTFNEHYRGNRAPFGVYTHPIWLGPANQAIPDGSQKLAAVNKFLDQAQSNPDVWLITNSQLIQYMKNPVPASELGKQSYMTCVKQAPSDICNGLTGTGVETCPFPSGKFQVCYLLTRLAMGVLQQSPL